MASTIIPCSELNIKDLKFYAPKATQGGGKNVGIMHLRTHTALRVALPIMFTFGASDYQGNQQYSFSLQFPDSSDPSVSPEYAECLRRLVEFEVNLKQKVLEFSKDWLGKQLKNIEMVDMIWTPMLKYPKNPDTKEPDHNRSPTLSVKLPCWEGKWTSEVYDENRVKLFPCEDPEVTPLQFITRGNNMATIVQCGGLWIVGGKMGVTWKLVQTVVKQQNTSISGVCHISLKETDKTKLSSVADLTKHSEPEPDIVVSSTNNEISSHADDSDDEDDCKKIEEREEHAEEEEEEEEEEPSVPTTSVPPPPPPASDRKPRGRTSKK
jgi:hypothetical protein